MYKFLRNRVKSNLYQKALMNKLHQKNINKLKKKNLVNKTLKSVAVYFKQIKGRIDTGNMNYEEKEKDYNKLISKIADSRQKFWNKINKQNSKSNNNSISSSRTNILKIASNTQSDYISRNKNKIKLKKSDKKFEEDFDSLNSSKNENIPKTKLQKKKLLNNTEESKIKHNFGDNPGLSHFLTKKSGYSAYSKTTNNNKSLNEHISNYELKIQGLDELELIQRNNKTLMNKQKWNPIYWNRNRKKIHTAGFRAFSNQVRNEPLYITKISDLIKEYNRIKSSTKRSKKNIEEKLFNTYNNLNEIMKIKEDLLMFQLKQKYLNCSFPYKKKENVSKKRIFIAKFKDEVKYIDDFYGTKKDLDEK